MKNLAKLALACAVSLSLVACSSAGPSTSSSPGLLHIRLGDLQTDDLLALDVAQDEGLLKDAGIDLTITIFQSAQEQVAAMQAGQIDAMMTEVMVSAQLTDSGTPVRLVTALQGAPIGLVGAPGAGMTKPQDLAGVEVGGSSNTIAEFIFEKAMTDAGVPADQIKTSEVPKMPVRMQLLISGQLKAAALPWTFYYLAISQGATPIVGPDVTSSYTQTVLAFRQSWLDQPGAADTVKALLKVNDQGVDIINADPAAQRPLIVKKANLSASIADTYPVRTYPKSAAVDRDAVTGVLDWMKSKGQLKTDITYESLEYQP